MVETLEPRGSTWEHLLPEVPAAAVPTYSQLIEADDVPDLLCRRLRAIRLGQAQADELAHPDSIRATLHGDRAVHSGPRPPIRLVPGTRRIMAAVGPTGVGKTAAVLGGGEPEADARARSGLITVDTYRIAAVEQLKTYAEIIDLPLAVVNDPSRCRDLDELGSRSTWCSSTRRAAALVTR